MAADLLYKSVLGLCLIISRAAKFLPKPALNKIPSLCVFRNLYDIGPQNGGLMLIFQAEISRSVRDSIVLLLISSFNGLDSTIQINLLLN